ncbi:hypothetical protein C8R48DRAFT_614777, partial [Suillus tomentosus]
ACLARTCKTFNEPALDTLWQDLDGLEPLLSCMPRYIFTAKLDTIDDRVVRALNSAPSPLLPNSRDLSWHDVQERFIPFLCTLLGSTITLLQMHSRLSSHPSFAEVALLASLEAYIRELECFYDDAICTALCGLKELLRLKT